MMLEITRQLNKAIMESVEYQAYRDAKSRIMEQTELYQAMNTFRKRNYELQTLEDGLNHFIDLRNLANEYGPVLNHPLVNDFLKAEQIFSKKMSKIYEVMVEGIELDYDYME